MFLFCICHDMAFASKESQPLCMCLCFTCFAGCANVTGFSWINTYRHSTGVLYGTKQFFTGSILGLPWTVKLFITSWIAFRLSTPSPSIISKRWWFSPVITIECFVVMDELILHNDVEKISCCVNIAPVVNEAFYSNFRSCGSIQIIYVYCVYLSCQTQDNNNLASVIPGVYLA